MKICCIAIGSHITVQGPLIFRLPDGRAIVKGGNGPRIGGLSARPEGRLARAARIRSGHLTGQPALHPASPPRSK